MDKIVGNIFNTLTLEGWKNLTMILDFAAADVLDLTATFDTDTGELKATGARVVLLPRNPKGVLLRAKVYEFGIPAKPEKYVQLAAEKAHRVNTTELFTSAESRDPDTGKYGGAHAINTGLGAVGLSGLAEPDDHVVLGLAMRAAGLIYESDRYNGKLHNRHCLTYVEYIAFEVWPGYPPERFAAFRTIFVQAEAMYEEMVANMKAIRKFTAS